MKRPRTLYLLLTLLAGVSLGLLAYSGPFDWIERVTAWAAPPQENPYAVQRFWTVEFADDEETIASTAQNQADLVIDDGSFESAVGLNQPGTINIVNRLQPPTYPATLTQLFIFFRTTDNLTQGAPITLLVGTNPDGDENINGTFFQQTSASIQSLGQFNTYNVSGPTINSGDFVVGFRMQIGANVFPGAVDTTPPSNRRSYVSTDGSNFTLTENIPGLGGGNFGIRARVNLSSPPPPPAAGLSGLVASYIDASRGDNGTGNVTILQDLTGSPVVDGSIITQGANAEVVIAPNGQYAIAHPAGPNADSVSVITGLDSSPFESRVLQVGNFPNAVAITSDSTTAIVVNALTSPVTYRIITGLPTAPTVSSLFSISSATDTVAEDVALSPSGDTAVISLFHANQVAIIGGVRGSPFVRGTVNVGNGPNGVAFAPGGNTAFVANTLDNSIEVISGLLPGGTPFGVRRITSQVGPNPQAIQLTPDGSKAVVTNTGGNTVSIFQVVGDNLTFLQTLTVGQAPAGLAISSDGRTALVANADSNTVSVIRGLDTSSAFVATTLGSSAQLDTTTFAERSVALTPAAPPPPPNVPDIDVTPTSLDFGSITVGQSTDRTLTVRNFGNATLFVNSITSNNSRFSVISPVGSFSVAPNGQQVVTVRFSPTTTGSQTGTLTINSNDPDETNVFVQLTGQGATAAVPDIDVTPTSLDFGSITVGQSADRTLTVRNFGNATLFVNSITSNNSRFSVISPVGSFSVPPNGQQVVTVRFSPNTVGSQNGTLTINSNDPDETNVFVQLTGQGATAAVPDIDVTPTSLDFGSVTVGQSADRTFTVRNFGNATLFVNSISSNNSRFSVISPVGSFSVPPNGQQVVTVRFSPNTVGSQNGTLTINSNDPDETNVFVSLSGQGVTPTAPDIDVTPTSLDFGSVTVGQSADRTFTVRNFGNATLFVNSITSNNSRFSVISPVGSFSVPPNGQQVVTVRFSPNTVGSQNGTLTINSNDPDETNVFVQLTGQGQVAGDPNEPNDSPQQATFISTPAQGGSVSAMGDATPDDAGTIANQITTECMRNQTIQDWFRLVVNQRGAFGVSLSFTSSEADFDLYMFIQTNDTAHFPQGIQLMARSDAAVPGQQESIGARVLEPGTYFIGVSRVRRNNSSDFQRVAYTLTVTRGSSPELHAIEDVTCVGQLIDAPAGLIVVNQVRGTQTPWRLEAISALFFPHPGRPSPNGRPVRIIAFTDPSGSGTPPGNRPFIVDQMVTINLPGGDAGAFVPLNLGSNGPLINSGDLYVGFFVDPANGIFPDGGRVLFPGTRTFGSFNNNQSYQPLTIQGSDGQLFNVAIRATVNTRPFGKMSVEDAGDRLGPEKIEVILPREVYVEIP